jgi:cyclophilin family peptidyl-prolyl cis-trans isomerase
LKRLLCALLISGAIACSQAGSDPSATQTEQTTTTAAAATASAAAPVAQEEKPMEYYQDKVAVLKTTAGEIHIRFFPDVAPNHVKNFIDLAERGFYNGTKFHRVIPDFMIQGGDPNTVSGDPSTWGIGGSGNHLKAEFNTVPHTRGIVSMARSQDPHSASSQFFIVVGNNAGYLDRNYTVFGQVTKGMEVADAIVAARRDRNDRPDNPTTITTIEIRPANEDEKGPAPK